MWGFFTNFNKAKGEGHATEKNSEFIFLILAAVPKVIYTVECMGINYRNHYNMAFEVHLDRWVMLAIIQQNKVSYSYHASVKLLLQDYFYKSTGVNNCAWLPLRPYPYPNDVQGDCEVRNLCRRAADKWRRSGRERRQPPPSGGSPLSGAPPTHNYTMPPQ